MDASLGWSLASIADAVGGTLLTGGRPDADQSVVLTVATDSRQAVSGALFIALRGELFDAHEFVGEVMSGGAVCVLVEAGHGVAVVPRIEVVSTEDALLALAVRRRRELTMPVIAVSGSTGKTSTKDLIAAGIEGSWASPRSYNNEIGVPLTILSTPDDATALVLEVGSRGRGHIEWLRDAISADVAVLTNLGVVHLETFGTVDGLADAKFELIEALKPGGVAVIPADEPMLHRPGAHRTLTFTSIEGDGQAEGADIVAFGIELDEAGRPSFALSVGEECFDAQIPLSGAHHAANAAAAVGVAIALKLDLSQVISRLSLASGSAWRMEVHAGSYTVVNDAYNANPQSVASALRTVCTMGNRIVAVLGEMAELGPVCEFEHASVGALAGELGVAELLVVGSDHGYALGFPGVVRKAANIAEAADTLAGIIEPGDVVLVKASRSVGLERLALTLIEDSQQ